MTRLLIIEDNQVNRELITYLLRAYGYELLIATDGEQGLALAQRERPDLILCDIQIPGIDGYEIARRLKGDPALKGIPLIAVTALAMVGDSERILAAGFEDYIGKPIRPEPFMAKVEAYLQPHQRRALPLRQPKPSQATQSVPKLGATLRTLLVVDDRATNRLLISNTFEHLGYTVLCAENISHALALARETPPDLILSDVHLRGAEEGPDFLRIIKSDPQLRQIPFVFLSSSSGSPHDLTYLSSLGVADVIVRPIKPEQLPARVEACLKK